MSAIQPNMDTLYDEFLGHLQKGDPIKSLGLIVTMRHFCSMNHASKNAVHNKMNLISAESLFIEEFETDEKTQKGLVDKIKSGTNTVLQMAKKSPELYTTCVQTIKLSNNKIN